MKNLEERVKTIYSDIVNIKGVQIVYSEIDKNNEVTVDFYIPHKELGCTNRTSTFQKKINNKGEEYWYMRRDWND